MGYLLYAAELVGTAAFALSGSLLAIQKRLDLFGVLFLGVVTALGGGTLRDLLLGTAPPRMFYNMEYVCLAIASSLLIFLIVEFRHGRSRIPPGVSDFLMVLCDALGLGIFSVIGTQAGIQAGYGDNMFLCVFLGMTTGVGGRILRDIMCKDIPFVLRKHIYAVAAISGGGVFYLLLRAGINQNLSTLAGMLATLTLRLLAWHYRWNLPRATAPEGQETKTV